MVREAARVRARAEEAPGRVAATRFLEDVPSISTTCVYEHDAAGRLVRVQGGMTALDDAIEQIAPMMSLTRFTARVLDKIRCSNGVKSGRVGVKITLRLARADNGRV